MELKGSEARIQRPGSAVDWMPIVFHVLLGRSLGRLLWNIRGQLIVYYDRASVTKRLSVKVILSYSTGGPTRLLLVAVE
jgi:hypothetical protein